MPTLKKDAKQNYSFRLSEETVALIDKQKGNTRTEKFENLVFSREQKIKDLNWKIEILESQYKKLQQKVQEAEMICSKLQSIDNYITYASKLVPKLE